MKTVGSIYGGLLSIVVALILVIYINVHFMLMMNGEFDFTQAYKHINNFEKESHSTI